MMQPAQQSNVIRTITSLVLLKIVDQHVIYRCADCACAERKGGARSRMAWSYDTLASAEMTTRQPLIVCLMIAAALAVGVRGETSE